MILTSNLVEQALSQFDARVIPDSHPVVPQLNRMFGEHTFFLDRNGLHIVEMVSSGAGAKQTALVINLADWDEGDSSSLTPHEPKVTDIVIELDPGGPAA